MCLWHVVVKFYVELFFGVAVGAYDLGFKKDNGIYYCSELVYDIYKKQLGIELCEMKRVSDYLILGTNNVPKIKKAMKRRGITMDQEVVAPKDIFYSDELEFVD